MTRAPTVPRVRLVESGGITGVQKVCEVPLADLPPAARPLLRYLSSHTLPPCA